jgi:multidrug efflux pump subunit AcrA (membrane-fusion protein)
MARFGDLDTQYFDASGDPLVNGKIYFYESGTTTPKTTFADINSEIPNTNPVLLDASGRQPNIFFEGVAKATLTNNNDVQIVSRDPVGETATNFGDEWVSTRIYGTNDVVIGSDGQYYRSLLTGNQNNNPVTTSGYWSLLYSVEWNAGINYDVSATVTYDTLQYQSLQTSNLNHTPDASPTWWVPLEFAWSATSTYADNQNVVGTDGVLYTSQQAANLNNDPTDPANRPTYWVGTSTDAATSAAAAAASEAAAATSETNAQTAETGAQTAQTAAELAETNAQTAQTAAELAETNAQTAQVAAELAETNAETAETNAETAQTAAETAQAAAETAQVGAETAETNAAASASNSATSASNSATSASNASASQSAAATSAANALTSENNASASESASATSEANASSSATASAGSATAASGSATAAATSAGNAATAEAGAEAALDEFTDIYLGAFASDPTTDNDGDPLAAGMLYYNTSADVLRVYSGTAWQDAGSAVNGTSNRATYTATSGQTTFAIVYDVGYVDVYLNGVKLIAGTDYTATNGTSIVLTTGATLNDLVDIIAFGTFNVANALTNADIGVTVQAYDADTTKNDVANTFTANQTFDNGIIEEYNATGTSGAVTVDLDTGNNFSTAMAGAVTYTFSNPATSGKVSAFTLKVVNDGNAITWPASVDWPAATAPTLSASGATDVFVFYTHDGGTTWYGFTAGQAMA